MHNLYNIKNEEILSRAIEGGDFGVLEWCINKGEMIIYEKVQEIVGCKFENISNMFEFIESIAYEEDKILAIEEFNNYIKGLSTLYRSIFRIKTQNGEVRWIFIKGKIIKGKAETYDLFSGIIVNVTEDNVFEGCDSLTKIPNRIFFLKKLKYSIEKNKHNNKKGALIHINIDNFKTLNYNLGNVFGDCVLKVFSQAINELAYGIGELGRLGGDDFGLIIHQFNYIKEIEEVCNKIHERLNKPFEINGDSIFLTVSLGIAVFPHDSSEIDELLKFCDFARYKSKQIGKNKCFFFDKKISEEYFRRALIEVELKKSIIDKELSICYQPQIDSLNNRIIGIEALLRWKNNKLGNVSPDEFIPIAESSGFIVQIGKWVFDEVLKNVNVWQNRGYKFNTISINVSPIQIKESDFIEKVLSGCLKNNIKPSIIELEITEGTLMQISKEKIEELKELMNNGISIALDDFGIGYSSLNYLTKLPISTLKIDKSFVDDIKNESNQAVIRCIIELSKTLKYKIITEGVETKEQLNLLKELGCNIIQGYYFSKPLPQDEIEDLLKLYVV